MNLDFSHKTLVMGILNVTPDSFSDGGKFLEKDRAVEHGIKMALEGADIIDIGGETTKPYSNSICVQEEIDRVVPIIEILSRKISIPISIDTTKAPVAEAAVNAGASIINDISALKFDENMLPLAVKKKTPVILMHMQGTPASMQQSPVYKDLIGEIKEFLKSAANAAVSGGIPENMIIVDPGIGFGKTFNDNLTIIREFNKFLSLGFPVLAGPSNKGFIGHILKIKDPSERLTGTMAAVAACIMNGASIVRVHRVAEAVETVKIIDAIKYGC